MSHISYVEVWFALKKQISFVYILFTYERKTDLSPGGIYWHRNFPDLSGRDLYLQKKSDLVRRGIIYIKILQISYVLKVFVYIEISQISYVGVFIYIKISRISYVGVFIYIKISQISYVGFFLYIKISQISYVGLFF